ncbi:YitT family protein [Vitreoscilla massiliensis]|uniref:YitT family protein n=1 Tax=Vitreoscilla massiliensis TaxID=1689272 RepID=A0ABY4E5N3_9NEIS|nr:membrane protein [Vitreoscilla massiliensis]UOO91089.1 YitT family protein [Vitreoscilla massiliensis]
MKNTPIPIVPWRAPSLWSLQPYPLLVSIVSLFGFGIGDGLLLQSHLGNSPWTIFAEGLSLHTPLSVGMSSMLLSALILLLWWPLRIKIGLNTILNAVLIAIAIDVTRQYVPTPTLLWQQLALGISGIVLAGICGAFYLSVNMGAGPRDGVMVALSARTGMSVPKIRTLMEVFACLSGWLLGGTVGLGTIAFALLIGPVLGLTLKLFRRCYPHTSGL